MSIPDLDKLKRDADGMFDFLGEEAANNAQRPRNTKSGSDDFNMPIIRKPVPVSESGALRAGSASELPDLNDDFDFLKSENSAHAVARDDEDLFEGVHEFVGEKERSLQLPLLILLSIGLFAVAGLATYWFSQNDITALFKSGTSDVALDSTFENAQIAPPASPTDVSADLVNPAQVESVTDSVTPTTFENQSAEQGLSFDSTVDSASVVNTPSPSSLYTQFTEQLAALESLLSEGKLSEAETRLTSMDRSVYGYGQAEFEDIQQQIVRMRGGTDALEQAEGALVEQLEKERLAAQVKQAEEVRIAEQARLDEEARLAALAKQAEEARVAEQARLDEEVRLAALAKQAEEARVAEQARLAEEARLAAQAKQAEEARIAEQARLDEEARLAAQAEQAEEARIAEQARLTEEARLAAQAKQAELARLAEQARQIEAAQLAEQARQAAAEQAVTSPSSDQLLLEQQAAAMLAQREKAAEAQRRAAVARARLAAQRAAEASAARAAREAQAARAALAEQNRLAALAQSNRAQPGLTIQPRQQNTPISDADFNAVAERFVELKNAIENRDITAVIALTQQSGQRVQQMLQLFENNEAVEARVSNIRSSNADGIISGTLNIQKLIKSGGLKVDAPDNLSSIRLTSHRTNTGWSPIGW